MLIARPYGLQSSLRQEFKGLMECCILRLLLIEDIDDIQAILQFTLETLSGWQVITATSTQNWLALAAMKKPDVILLDSHPYDPNILAQLKANLLTQDIPVVCLVARDRLTDQLQAKKAGATAIISKPFDPIILAETILNAAQLAE